MPEAGGPFYSGDEDHTDRWIRKPGNRTDANLPKHVVHSFFPIRGNASHNGRRTTAGGRVYLTCWDYKFEDNAGYYRVFLARVEGRAAQQRRADRGIAAANLLRGVLQHPTGTREILPYLPLQLLTPHKLPADQSARSSEVRCGAAELDRTGGATSKLLEARAPLRPRLAPISRRTRLVGRRWPKPFLCVTRWEHVSVNRSYVALKRRRDA